MAAGRILDRLFGRYLVITNTATSVSLFAFGDLVQQMVLERRSSVDWPRTGRMTAMGLLIGPLNHYWYRFLDIRWPGKTHRMVLTKVLSDEIVYAPIGTSVFYLGMGALEKRPARDSIAELREKFLPTYVADWKFWPAVQLVNFYLVPVQYRVLVVNLATLVWNTFLSYMKHKPSSVDHASQSEKHGK